MRNTVRSWLEGRSKPPTQSAAQLQASAARAVRAMHAALAAPGGDAAADAALVQVPLESIVGGDAGAGLAAVRKAIELEQRVVEARLAAAEGAAQQPPAQQQHSEGSGGAAKPGADPQQQAQQPMVGYFSSISAGWADSDGFDSGADSPPGGSSDTEMDSDFDP